MAPKALWVDELIPSKVQGYDFGKDSGSRGLCHHEWTAPLIDLAI